MSTAIKDQPTTHFWILFTGYTKDVYAEDRVFEQGRKYKAKRKPDRRSDGYVMQVFAQALDGRWLRVYDGEFTHATKERAAQ